jgi:hypothetical protein
MDSIEAYSILTLKTTYNLIVIAKLVVLILYL